MPRFPSFIVGTLLAVIPAAGRRIRAGDFVGVNHPAEKLSLRLERSGRFALRLSVWDPVVGAFVATRELTGRWRCTLSGGIKLCGPTRTLWYGPSSGASDGWVWERSTMPTFADGIVLLRRTADIH